MEIHYEILTTERLLLKKLDAAELNYLFGNFSDEKIKLELGITTEVQFLKEKEKFNNGFSDYKRTILLFKLIDKFSGKIIGNCGYHNWQRDHFRAEIGYDITVETYRRQGLMSEAVKKVIEYGFTKMNLNRIEACAKPDNIPSIRLLGKNNFQYEGLLRQHYYVNGVFEDSAFFALLKKDYLKST